jgi:hypothetical protein
MVGAKNLPISPMDQPENSQIKDTATPVESNPPQKQFLEIPEAVF